MIIFFSYIFYFLAASISPLQRRWLAVKKPADNKSQIVFAFQITTVVSLLSLLLPIFSPFYLSGNPWVILKLALLSGVFGAAVYVINYITQKHVEAGVTSVVSNIYTPVTIFFSSLFLGEKLTGLQILGTILLLVGVLVVSKKHQTGKFTFDKYFLLMLFSGVILAVVLVAERALQKETGFTAGTMISWGTQWLVLGIATLITKSKSDYSLKDIGYTGFFRFLQTLSWVALVFIVGNLSYVSAVTSFKVVIVFIAAAVFLKERDGLFKKALGSILAVVGLLLMK